VTATQALDLLLTEKVRAKEFAKETTKINDLRYYYKGLLAGYDLALDYLARIVRSEDRDNDR
jgi:hypothetical protein